MNNKTNGAATKLIGERMRIRRKELGLSLDEVARGASISTTQLHKYETGLSKIDCEKMIEIAKFLAISPSYFFDEKLSGQNWLKLLAHFERLKHAKIQELVVIVAEKAIEIEDLIKV